MKRDKKGQLGNLTPIIGTLVVVGIIIGVGFLVLQEFQEQDSLFSSKSTVNETNAWLNETNYQLLAENGGKTKGFSLDAIWAVGTGGSLYNQSVPVSNATVVTNDGTVTNATTVTQSNVSYSYSYNEGSNSWEGVNDTISATQSIPNLLGLIVLILIVGIVLAIVFNVIPGARGAGA